MEPLQATEAASETNAGKPDATGAKMAKVDTQQASEQIGAHRPPLMRHSLDWLLGVAILALSPLLATFALDLWYRTDLWFFPILPLSTLGLAAYLTRLSPNHNPRRSGWAIGIVVVASLLSATAAWLFSPWLAALSLILVVFGWMLERFGALPWFHCAFYCLPLCALLVFPISDAGDITYQLSNSVTYGTSSLLEIFGIANLPSNSTLEVRDGQLSVGALCRGLGSPYLLLSLTVLLSMYSARQLLIGLLSMLSVPVWSWFGGVAHLTVGTLLLEWKDVNILSGDTRMQVQAGILVFLLLSIFLMQIAMRILLAPFTAYAEGVGGLHRFYNRVVMWPERDPLRKRFTTQSDQLPADRPLFALPAVRYSLVLPAVLFCLAAFRSIPSGPWQLSEQQAQSLISEDLLPNDLLGMKKMDFAFAKPPALDFPNTYSGQWVYSAGAKRIEILIAIPYRGAFPAERRFRESPQARVISKQQAIRVSTIVGPDANEVQNPIYATEVVYADTLFGSSYVCYTDLKLSESGDDWSVDALNSGSKDSVAFQPSVANASVLFEGSGSAMEENEKEFFRSVLLVVSDALAKTASK